MVYIIQPQDCDCETCNGGNPAPEGQYGGSVCSCPCHQNRPKGAVKIKKEWSEEEARLKLKCEFMEKENRKAYEDLHFLQENNKSLQSQIQKLQGENVSMREALDCFEDMLTKCIKLTNNDIHGADCLYHRTKGDGCDCGNGMIGVYCRDMLSKIDDLSSTPLTEQHARYVEALEKVVGAARNTVHYQNYVPGNKALLGLAEEIHNLDTIKSRQASKEGENE